MVQGLVSWGFKTVLSLVVWVFILSLRWEGRTLFDRAHEVLVDNRLVEMLDAELVDLWQQVSTSAQLSLSGIGQNDEKVQ